MILLMKKNVINGTTMYLKLMGKEKSIELMKKLIRDSKDQLLAIQRRLPLKALADSATHNIESSGFFFWVVNESFISLKATNFSLYAWIGY